MLQRNESRKEQQEGVSVLHVLVLGAAGMVGRKLVDRLLRDGRLGKSRYHEADAA